MVTVFTRENEHCADGKRDDTRNEGRLVEARRERTQQLQADCRRQRPRNERPTDSPPHG